MPAKEATSFFESGSRSTKMQLPNVSGPARLSAREKLIIFKECISIQMFMNVLYAYSENY